MQKKGSFKNERQKVSSDEKELRDLTSLLGDWSYDESKTVRRIEAQDGREILQVRLPLGVEQYEIDGRPDGKRPMSCESWLHYYSDKARLSHRDSMPFSLEKDDFARLQQEGLLYYYRYLLFFQMREYALCTRDTRRNLKLLDFVVRYSDEEDAEMLEQYRPYILRMNVMARALFRLQEHEDLDGALRILHSGVNEVESLEPIDGNQVFEFEKTRSLRSLEDLIGQLEAHAPEHVALQNELERAIEKEDYERAAVLRDEIEEFKSRNRLDDDPELDSADGPLG